MPRTAGAPRALAREVPDGRGYLDRSVRILVSFSLGVELRFLLLPFLVVGDLVRTPRTLRREISCAHETVELRWARHAKQGCTRSLVPPHRHCLPANLSAGTRTRSMSSREIIVSSEIGFIPSLMLRREATYDPRTSVVSGHGATARLMRAKPKHQK